MKMNKKVTGYGFLKNRTNILKSDLLLYTVHSAQMAFTGVTNAHRPSPQPTANAGLHHTVWRPWIYFLVGPLVQYSNI